MPIPIARKVLGDGFDSVPFIWPVLKTLPYLAVLYLAKLYFNGTANTSERKLHGKVVLVTVGLPSHAFHFI